MKPNHPLFWVIILASSGILGFAYSTYLRMDDEIQALKKKVTELELQSIRPTRLSFVTVAPKTVSMVHDAVFKALQVLNKVQSPEDAKKEKRVLLNQNILKVQDPTVVSEDPFYDMLGALMDEDLIQQIQIPDPMKAEKAQRPLYRSIRQEMIRFGIPSENLLSNPDNSFIIILKKSV
ncbi:MAG: hypothetical protein JST80_07035 [Bdellovibrionales bacterium]|nr:hypothetical protein [Bdellovibrionales bacterium]